MSITFDLSVYPFVDLPLTKKTNPFEVAVRSGLNWGQRPEYNRESNQAYIPVHLDTHQNNPGFFPPRGTRFTILTDDGEEFTCVMAQDNNKAIETCDNNSILGIYFRQRLNLPLGFMVTIEDLLEYGRTYVRVYKIQDYLYYMDFRS
ncbi:phospholipase D-like domain-containing protein [Aneurinibacillus migulanus]|uniref:NgoFVII restriction endonuclease n=1 Tax=Aneurinibacillus migulanus TaxID=47500 RepID=A0A0D1W3C5_ANEMI|nr:restriction endonuclease PLD domain-containing protein [Aneurinibacillus migulanus]KIV52895.1 hypothetical protein TS65_22615 [Aneurinibacillus migulanus]KON95172.1 hypothetical protein AF333_06455 [Aneurinibacillus migulanus]MED0890907.1 NgoFVII family restriction endonuclease [Aneurinibacillus migulanus]MED1616599.1 NgoFVII family restriction endonuclease [Aneurinibacillus migulanus]SDI82263.1 NgoFVII restriction endonuclease [Aneurinibacillus migulanus]